MPKEGLCRVRIQRSFCTEVIATDRSKFEPSSVNAVNWSIGLHKDANLSILRSMKFALLGCSPISLRSGHKMLLFMVILAH